MQRALIVIAAVVALIVVLIWRQDEQPAAPTTPPSAAPGRPPSRAATNPDRGSAPPRSAGASPSTASSNPPTAATADAAVEEQGPFEVELGRHVLTPRDPVQGRKVSLRLRLTVDTAAAKREVRMRREELVRMLFFLAANRAGDAVEGDDGRRRFEADLMDRFRNVVRSGQILRLDFLDYAVERPLE